MLKELFMGKSPMKEEPKKKISLVLKDDAVTTNTIKDKAVTFKKFSDDAVGNIRDMIDSTVNADKNSIANLTYYECATASQDEIKSVETPYYYLTVGGAMRIKMLHSNSYEGTVKLKVGNAEAQTLFYNGAAISSSNTWDAGETLVVYFDGNVYQAIGIDSLIEKHISSAETNFHEYVDNVAATIQQSIDAIVNSDDTEAINTIGEIATFLEGISNTTTLTALLNAEKEAREQGDATLNSKMGTLANNIAYNKDSLQHSIDNVDAKIAPLEESVNDVSSRLDTVEDDVDSIKDIVGTSEEEGTLVERINEMENLIDGKVDKEEGKSLIDEDYAEDIYYDDSLQYMKVITDANGAILWAITKTGDIKYGYGVPEQIKEYVNSEVGDEVSRAIAAEKELQDNIMIEASELPEATENTLDHVYLIPAETPTSEFTKEKWITVTSEGVKFSEDGKGYKVVNMSEDARDWTENIDSISPASPGIYLNKNWNGNRALTPGYIPRPEDKAGVLRKAGEMAGVWDDTNLSVQYGQVYFMQADAALHENDCYWMATTSGWKVYQPNDGIIDESILEGTVYSWEKITSNVPNITASTISVGESLEILENDDVDVIQAENALFIDAPIAVFSGDVDIQSGSLTVGNSSVKKGSTFAVTATGQSMNYNVGTMYNGDIYNIFFTHHPDDVGNTQHTVNVTAGGKTLTCTFQASSYCEVCVTRVNDTYFLREVPAGV